MSFDATLVVMAAGMGSRFGGLKQIEPLGPNGEALLDYSVYDAKKAGFNKVVFIIKHAIEKDFRRFVGSRIEKSIDVDYVFQETDMLPNGFVCPENREKPWGTGHAIYCCRNAVKTPFAVINADDYYGKTAYEHIYNHLKTDSQDYCMVGFRLANTLTENGSVSRGVCNIENGILKSVTERTKIIDCKYTEDDVHWTALPSDTVVSMNMWGFTPDYFEYSEEYFKEFLKANMDNLKAEYFIPLMVNKLINDGTARVKVLDTTSKWFGVTYAADRQGVVDKIQALVDAGEYPAKLF